jgi:hypothetical protein
MSDTSETLVILTSVGAHRQSAARAQASCLLGNRAVPPGNYLHDRQDARWLHSQPGRAKSYAPILRKMKVVSGFTTSPFISSRG